MSLSNEFWNKEIYDRLLETLESTNISCEEKNAVFDFDNTLILGDQGYNLMYYLILNQKIHIDKDWFWSIENWIEIPNEYKQKIHTFCLSFLDNTSEASPLLLLDQFLVIFEFLEKKNLELAYRWTKIFYAGFSKEELKMYSKISFQEALKKDIKEIQLPSGIQIQQGIRIRKAFYELIQSLFDFGWNVYIVTASPEVAIQALGHYWNLPETNIIGMKLKTKDQILLPEIEEPFTYNYGKYLAFKTFVQKPIYIAVGDSYPDIYLLENSKIPIFVNHSNKETLLQIAKEKNFYIQNVN